MTDHENEEPVVEENSFTFFAEGDYTCAADDCEEGPFTADALPELVPVIFDVECPNHGKDTIVFHSKCMPDEYRAALNTFAKRQNSRWN